MNGVAPLFSTQADAFPSAAAAAAVEPSSFRDPSGFIFERGGVLYRQVNTAGAAAYARLMRSGLYEALVSEGLLVAHAEVDLQRRMTETAAVVLMPERVPFVTYGYEWCFGQLRDAALATLAIQRMAIGHGMSLRDASAYNIQFRNGCRPVLIDTLSFEEYREGAPWVAYRQFCQHFLAPLALMAYTDVRMGEMLRPNVDGIPLDLAARLLPLRDRFRPALMTHLFLHSAAQRRHAADNARSAAGRPTAAAVRNGSFGRNALLGLLDSLEGGIRSLSWRPEGTVWGAYYGDTNYTAEAFDAKRAIVARLLDGIRPEPGLVLDIGANNGAFSHLAADRGILTLAVDADPAAVEQCYRDCRQSGRQHLLPLLQDLMNPSPSLGWAAAERRSFLDRCTETEKRNGTTTVAFALALVHHLAIANNVPLPRIAALFAQVAEHLIVEWVPKEDSQVRRLLATREDIFPDYTEAGFETAFLVPFALVEREPIPGSERVLYHLRRREAPQQ